jgi:hypothetical protein
MSRLLYAIPLGLLFLSGCAGHYHHHHYHRRVVYVRARPAQPPPVVQRSVENPDSPPFDATTARGLLSSVDVSACRDAGQPETYGHAKVTFDPDGHITKVVVDEPRGLSPATVSCVGSRLGMVTVPVFRGSSVTMGTTYRL